MLPKHKQLILKSKRRTAFLLVVIFLLGYWIRVNYLEIQSQRDEVFSLSIDNSEKDLQIKKLNEKLDSINKSIKKIEKPKIIINKKKVDTKQDVVSTEKIDTIPKKEISDTISN